ncbi:hypothetical protein [Sphingomonas parapaucimobilis]|jgi:hypothetical protein
MATIVSPAPDRNATLERQRLDYSFALYFMLRATGFLASTMLMAFGVYVLFFLAIGGFSLDGMMAHLANMAGRYVEAEPSRITGFKTIAGTTFLVSTLAIAFFRRHALVALLADMKDDAK